MLCGSEEEVWTMKTLKAFVLRGFTAAWGGPVILAIVYLILQRVGVVDTLTVPEVVKAILSMTVMAFIAAGISVVYQIEKLPLLIATVIQMVVLYVDYLLFYMMNGWVPAKGIGLFTVIFIAGFIIIWLIVYYCAVRPSVKKLNERINADR